MEVAKFMHDWYPRFEIDPQTAVAEYMADKVLNTMFPLCDVLTYFRFALPTNKLNALLAIENAVQCKASGKIITKRALKCASFSFNRACNGGCSYCSQSIDREQYPDISDDELLKRLDNALIVFFSKHPDVDLIPSVLGGDPCMWSQHLIDGIKHRFRYNSYCQYMTHDMNLDFHAKNWKGNLHILDWQDCKRIDIPPQFDNANIVVERGQVQYVERFIKVNQHNWDIGVRLTVHPCFYNNDNNDTYVETQEFFNIREKYCDPCKESAIPVFDLLRMKVLPCCLNYRKEYPILEYEPLDITKCAFVQCEHYLNS